MGARTRYFYSISSLTINPILVLFFSFLLLCIIIHTILYITYVDEDDITAWYYFFFSLCYVLPPAPPHHPFVRVSLVPIASARKPRPRMKFLAATKTRPGNPHSHSPAKARKGHRMSPKSSTAPSSRSFFFIIFAGSARSRRQFWQSNAWKWQRWSLPVPEWSWARPASSSASLIPPTHRHSEGSPLSPTWPHWPHGVMRTPGNTPHPEGNPPRLGGTWFCRMEVSQRVSLLPIQREEKPLWSQFHLPPSSPITSALSQSIVGTAEAREVQSSWFKLQKGVTKGILVLGGKERSARTRLGGCCRKGMGAGGGGCL